MDKPTPSNPSGCADGGRGHYDPCVCPSPKALDLDAIEARVGVYERHLEVSDPVDELTREDGVFISCARQDLPELIAEVRNLRARLSSMGEMVESLEAFLAFGPPLEGSARYHAAWKNLAALSSLKGGK